MIFEDMGRGRLAYICLSSICATPIPMASQSLNSYEYRQPLRPPIGPASTSWRLKKKVGMGCCMFRILHAPTASGFGPPSSSTWETDQDGHCHWETTLVPDCANLSPLFPFALLPRPSPATLLFLLPHLSFVSLVLVFEYRTFMF